MIPGEGGAGLPPGEVGLPRISEAEELRGGTLAGASAGVLVGARAGVLLAELPPESAAAPCQLGASKEADECSSSAEGEGGGEGAWSSDVGSE